MLDGDVSGWKAGVLAEAKTTLELLSRRASQLQGRAGEDAAVLLDSPGLIPTRIAAIGFDTSGARKLRYHGDYHLGQVLLRDNDFLIIDFEGEPARTLEERRAKHSPLRDVAGMLRSFDYARWSALRRAAQNPEEEAHCAPLAEAWLREARATFLEGYAEGVADAGLFGSFAAAAGLLRLFEFEKALYELRYELDNRPTWTGIPLAGLRVLAG